MGDQENPFKIGDRAIFALDEQAIAWTWSSFDLVRIHRGDEGIVSKIVDDKIFVDDDKGGFSWDCFKPAGR